MSSSRAPAPSSPAWAAGQPRLLLGLAALLALVLLLLTAPAALADVFTPESGGSEQAADIDTLYKITFAIGVVIFLIVEGTLIFSLVRYRQRRGAQGPAQIRGNAPLEIGWTVGAAVILLILSAVTFAFLPGIRNPPRNDPGAFTAQRTEQASVDQPAPPDGRALEIDVNGQQYLWRYTYPGRDRAFTYHEMVVPVNTTVVLKITAQDVIHSWWIPKLGGKMDAVPGHVNETWFKIRRPGTYAGVCAELCGENHADMRARVRAVPVEEFRAWLSRLAADIRQSRLDLAASRAAREGESNEAP